MRTIVTLFLYCALQLGARIIASAGTEEKRAALASTPGVIAVLNSRVIDATAWRSAVDAATAGRGVDVVLNSLAGDGIRASMSLLAPCGRFIEVGKANVLQNSALEMGPLLHNIR